MFPGRTSEGVACLKPARIFVGRVMIFVTGYHHSGTTIMQHSLLLALNYTTATRFPEQYPHANAKLPVLKYPLYRSIKDLQTLKTKTDAHADTVVYMMRDKPNTVWSLMKRNDALDLASAKRWSDDFCEKTTWWKTQKFKARVIPIHLVNFSFAPERTLKYILDSHEYDKKQRCKGRRLSVNALHAANEARHVQLRIAQLHSNITIPNLNTFHYECKNAEVVAKLLEPCQS